MQKNWRSTNCSPAGAEIRCDLDIGLIEQRVREILSSVPEYVWDGETLPVPVEEIVDSVYGLLVRDVEDISSAPGAPSGSDGNLSGLLYTDSGEIWVNAEEARKWPGRRRFTISHELGHWVMHRSGREAVFCRAAVIDPESADQDTGEVAAESPLPAHAIPLVETEADVFAAEMLMPPQMVIAHYEECDGDLGQLQDLFLTSHKATKRRVRDLVPKDRWRSSLLED